MAAASDDAPAEEAGGDEADLGLPGTRPPARPKIKGIGGLPTAASKSLKAELEEQEMIRCSVTGERVHNSEYTKYQRHRYDLDNRRCRAGTEIVHQELATKHRRYFTAHSIAHKDAWEAIRHNNFAFVYDALRSGFAISQRDKYTGRTMLHEAASVGDADICELLLEWEGCDVNSRCLVGRDTAIHFAAIGGNWKVVDMLCHYGADANDSDKFGLRPLHMATGEEVVKHLLRHGADETVKDSFGRTPLVSAEDREDLVVAELLREVALRRIERKQRMEHERVVLKKQADKARAQRQALLQVKKQERSAQHALQRIKDEYAAWRKPTPEVRERQKAMAKAKAKATSSVDASAGHKALLAKYDAMAKQAGRDAALRRLGGT